MCSTRDWSYMTLKCTSWHEKSGGKLLLFFSEILWVLFVYFWFDVFWALLDFLGVHICVCMWWLPTPGQLQANEADKTVRDPRIKMRGNHSEHRKIDWSTADVLKELYNSRKRGFLLLVVDFSVNSSDLTWHLSKCWTVLGETLLKWVYCDWPHDPMPFFAEQLSFTYPTFWCSSYAASLFFSLSGMFPSMVRTPNLVLLCFVSLY